MNFCVSHIRLGSLGLLAALGLFSAQTVGAEQKIAVRGQQQTDAGRKIQFSDPDKPFAGQKTETDNESQTAKLLAKFTSKPELMDAPSAPPPPAQAAKKSIDWLSKDSTDTADGLNDSVSPQSPNDRLVRAWDQNGWDRTERNGLRNSADPSRNNSSRADWLGKDGSDKTSRSTDRGWDPLKSSMDESPFQKLREGMRDRNDALKRQEDNQARIDQQFRAAYGESASPLTGSAANNAIHQSLWQANGQQRAFGEPTRPAISDLSSSAYRSRFTPYTPPAQNTGTHPRKGSNQQQDDRYSAPTVLEKPKQPGALF